MVSRILGLAFLPFALAGCSDGEAMPQEVGACWLQEGFCSDREVDGSWAFRLERGTDFSPGAFNLKISPPGNFAGKDLLSVWEGKTMYMGELPAPLHKVREGQWEGTVYFPDCSVDTMIWRMKLFSGGDMLPLEKPLQVVPRH